MGRPKSKVNMVTINVRVPEEDAEFLHLQAKEVKKPLSFVVRKAIRQMKGKVESDEYDRHKEEMAKVLPVLPNGDEYVDIFGDDAIEGVTDAINFKSPGKK